jgi:hypothetical protein
LLCHAFFKIIIFLKKGKTRRKRNRDFHAFGRIKKKIAGNNNKQNKKNKYWGINKGMIDYEFIMVKIF